MEWNIVEQTTQHDGTQRVQVDFTDVLNRKHRRSYDFPSKSDVSKEIDIRSINVEQGLKDQDINSAVTRITFGEAHKLEYATEAELKLKLQEVAVEKQSEIDRATNEKSKIDTQISVGEK